MPKGAKIMRSPRRRSTMSLNLNLHFHVVSLDGVFDRGADDALHFFQATPTTGDVERLVEDIARAAERWLAKQGYAGDDEDNAEDDDDAQGASRPLATAGRPRVATGERGKGSRPRGPRGRSDRRPFCCIERLPCRRGWVCARRVALPPCRSYALFPPLDRLLERITLDEGGAHVQYAMKDEPRFRHQAPDGPPWGSSARYRVRVEAPVARPRVRTVSGPSLPTD
jgi:hypothetical protein